MVRFYVTEQQDAEEDAILICGAFQIVLKKG